MGTMSEHEAYLEILSTLKQHLLNQAETGGAEDIYATEKKVGNQWTTSAWAKVCEKTREIMETMGVDDEEIGSTIQEATEKTNLIKDAVSYKK